MDCVLPTEFDVIVVGTGVVESTVSAAASRIGKRVLHIDSKDYYGGIWASFNLETIQKFGLDTDTSGRGQVASGAEPQLEGSVPIGNDLFGFKDVLQTWHIPEKDEIVEQDEKQDNGSEKAGKESEEKGEVVGDEAAAGEGSGVAKVEEKEVEPENVTWTQEKLMRQSRKFNIDLAPKLQFARGSYVELLISSNIARYSEFRSISRVLTYLNGQLVTVPCSRSDIFANSNVSVVEKRMLMKLLTTCMDCNEKEFEGYQDKSFKTYLKDRKLSSDLVHYILYAISMSNDETSCLEGVKNTKRFLNSLGRFGKTPFIYSMYGSGETPQAFCRMSAVFGGVYALNQPLKSLTFDNENNFKGIVCGEQKITADFLVTSIENAPQSFLDTNDIDSLTYISRGIFITDRSIMESQTENLTLLLFPTQDGKELCYVIEAGSQTGTCPKGLYIVYMFMRKVSTPKEDLSCFTEKLFRVENDDESKPKVLWSFYYSVPNTNDVKLCQTVSKNSFFCPGPDMDLDYDNSMTKAKEIFEEMYPDLELLPRAPDPEEIIIGDDEEDCQVPNDSVCLEGVKAADEKEKVEESGQENLETA